MAYLIAIICVVIVAVFWRLFASLALIGGLLFALVVGGVFMYDKHKEAEHAKEPAQFSLSSSGIGVGLTRPYLRTFPNMAACEVELASVHAQELGAPASPGTTVSEHGPSELWRESVTQREIRTVKCETKTQWSALDTQSTAPAPKHDTSADLSPSAAHPIAATDLLPKDKVAIFVAYATDGHIFWTRSFDENSASGQAAFTPATCAAFTESLSAQAHVGMRLNNGWNEGPNWHTACVSADSKSREATFNNYPNLK